MAPLEGQAMDREAPVDQVVSAIYDAAAEPERWPRALNATADLLGAAGAQFHVWDRHDNATCFAVVGRLPDEGTAAYRSHHAALDTGRHALEWVPVGEVAAYGLDLDDDRFASRKEESI